MRILLLGRSGQLGSALLPALAPLGEVTATGRAELDLQDLGAIGRAVAQLRPSLIVNAAALTSLEEAERDPARAHRVNAEAVGALGEAARKAGAFVVHYSTDCVFDGAKEAGYTEEDGPNPLGAYGRSKLAGEQALAATGCRFLVLRVAWLYAESGRSFCAQILRSAASGEPVRAISDRRGVPTPVRFVAAETVALLRGHAEGLFHLAPRGSGTWLDFAQAFAEANRLDVRIVPIRAAELPHLAPRPISSILLSEKAERALGRAFADWRALLAIGERS